MRRKILLAAAVLAIASPALAQPFVQFNFGPPPPHGSFWERSKSVV